MVHAGLPPDFGDDPCYETGKTELFKNPGLFSLFLLLRRYPAKAGSFDPLLDDAVEQHVCCNNDAQEYQDMENEGRVLVTAA
jgi:hypothetical protein